MTRLTDDDLQAIRERADSAAAGPWQHVQPEFRDHTSQSVKGAAGQVVAFAGYGLAPMLPWCNAEFIARARQDIPDLLAMIDDLTAENAELRARLARYAEGPPVQHHDHEGPTP